MYVKTLRTVPVENEKTKNLIINVWLWIDNQPVIFPGFDRSGLFRG